jgi:hypothetical protein
MIKEQLNRKKGMPNMCCKEISDCRQIGKADFIKSVSPKPKMRSNQVKYKKRTFLNWEE